MQSICVNGTFVPATQAVFTAANRGFKYGDGLFETARFLNGRLQLAPFHFERLFAGLQLLQIPTGIAEQTLHRQVALLCKKNNCEKAARVRIAFFRDAREASYLVEASPLPQAQLAWHEQGWQLSTYPHARKACDVFANLKSANYLPYLMAARYAAEQNVNECLLLNTCNRICDGSKTNVFFLKNGTICTPALAEGCVAGVMRRALLAFLRDSGYPVFETGITKSELLQADAVFVTNAIEGMRWVRRLGDKEYGYGNLKNLYTAFLSTI